MSKFKQQISEFTFVGQFSDCIISKKARIKYLKIDNGEEKNWIKLSKKHWDNLNKKLSIGSWLKIKGQKKTCLKTGTIKLEAETIEQTKTVEICDSNCNKCDFKRLVYSGHSSNQEKPQHHLCSQLEEGLSEHFRIRGNFSIKKLRSLGSVAKKRS